MRTVTCFGDPTMSAFLADSIWAVLPSDIHGAKTPFPRCTVIIGRKSHLKYSCFEKSCLRNGEKLTRKCRKLLWVMVAFTVA